MIFRCIEEKTKKYSEIKDLKKQRYNKFQFLIKNVNMNVKIEKKFCIDCQKETIFQSSGTMQIQDFRRPKDVHKNIGANIRLKMVCTICGYSCPKYKELSN